MENNSSKIESIIVTSKLIINLPRTFTSFFGIITNILCIIVFVNPKMKDKSFNYMLANSICDCLYLTILIFQLVEFCGDCPIAKKFATQIYIIYFDSFLTASLALFFIFVEIWIATQRYFLIRNKPFLQNISHLKVLPIIAFISLVYYLPLLFRYDILTKFDHNTNKTYYGTKNSDFTNTVGKLVYTVLALIRIFFNSILLSIVNILILIEFKRMSQNKSKMIKSKYAENCKLLYFYHFLKYLN